VSETPAVVYLEADDEITSVVRRVRASTEGRVVVVVPGRSRATSSAVALRLLARAGEEEGREVAVVGDALTRSLAAEAGLAAYATLDDARRADPPTRDEPAEVRSAAIHVVRGTDETVVTPAIAADEVTRPVRVVSRPAAPSRRRPIAAVTVVVLAVVLVLGLAGAAVLPGATVTIAPVTTVAGPVSYVIEVEDPERVSGTVEATATVAATGEYDILEPATGAVVLRNFSAADQPIGAGTLVAAGDQAYETQADIVVPRGSLTPQGTILAGEASVAVTAAAPGPAGNVGAEAIDTVLSEGADARLQGFPENNQRRVINPAPTEGGVDESGVVFRQRDVNAAVEALTADLRRQAADGMAPDPDTIVVRTELPEPTVEGTENLAGTRDQAEATIEGFLQWEAWRADRVGVTDAASERFATDPSAIAEGQLLVPESIEVVVGEATVEGGTMQVDVTATGESTAEVDPAEVADRITGLTADEAESELADLGNVTVELWPDFVASVPTLEWRIEVRVVGP
jgi:hypothetical protein